MEQTKIYVLDREEIVLYAMDTICAALTKEVQVTGKNSNLEKGLEEMEGLCPEVLFLDSRIYLQNEVFFQESFAKRFPHITLVFMISGDLAIEQENVIREQPLCIEKSAMSAENLRSLLRQIQKERKNPSEEKVMEDILAYMQEYYFDDLTLACLAEKFHYSYHYLSAAFGRYTGQSFAECLNLIRLKKACEMLETSQMSVAAVAHMTGYASQGYFSKAFKKYVGCSPKKYRNLKSENMVQKLA